MISNHKKVKTVLGIRAAAEMGVMEAHKALSLIHIQMCIRDRAISVSAFGTGGKRAKMFENIYLSVEDVDGIGVVYTKKGDYSAILGMDKTY